MRNSLKALTSAAAALICLAIPAAAQVTAVNGKIAYTVCDYSPVAGEVVCDIWTMNADGSEQTNLTNTPDLNESGPAWSPDGTRIAYVEGPTYFYKIMVMNADGSGVAPIVANPDWQFGPTWSADGLQIAFTRMTTGVVITTEFDIFVINVDGTGETNITNSDYDELDAAWSPDGTKIAFAGVRPEMSNGELLAQYEIVTVNPDGSGEQIVTAGIPGTPRGDFLEEDRAPAWSPDSALIVYMTQSVDPCCPPWQIEKVDRDGTNIVTLSDNPAFNDLSPSFSPDGTLLIFVSDRGGSLGFWTMPAPVPGPLPAAPSAITPLPTPPNADDPVWGRRPQPFEARSLALDMHGTGSLSNLNGVLEPGESVLVEPGWRNLLTIPVSFSGTLASFTGPAGGSYVLEDIFAEYGTAAAGGATDCYGATASHNCYQLSVNGTRPGMHWDASIDEILASGFPDLTKTWTLHIGESFGDVPTSQQFYAFIENLFHNGITGGCGDGIYCPDGSVTRAQMAVFLLKGKLGASHVPPPATGLVFGDVHIGDFAADWIEELASLQITGGCGNGNYCPGSSVTRAQMAAFLLKASNGSAYVPPACTGTVFVDVPCTGGIFDPWIEDLASRAITGGCGNNNYCPGDPNNRGQMATFLVKTFGLQLYGP
jgi:hypothetical protein